jgi:nucleoside 2-deoxyribosyltransferase
MIIKGKGKRIRKAHFEKDMKLLKQADVIIAVLNGTDVDSGTAVEASVAYSLGKKVIGLREDFRKYSSLEEVNLMVEGVCGWRILHNIKQVSAVLAELKGVR